MKKWFLSTYFEEVAIKRLSSVESNLEKSNQHEINGVSALIKMFWKAEMDKKVIPATFLYVSDSEGNFESMDGDLTRYDSRAKHPTRTEHRLYYPRNNVTEKIAENDVLIIAKQPTWNVLFLCVQSGSFIEPQILRLFDAEKISKNFQVIEISHDDKKIDFVTRFILEEIGIQINDIDQTGLERMIKEFWEEFPSTKSFSKFAREFIVQPIDPLKDPDSTILLWMEQEELLFRTFERFLINRKLKSGKNGIFNSVWELVSIDNFFQFSLSCQNRRKARVGQALENHLEELFRKHGIHFSRWGITEWNSKPDFIFPSIEYYHDVTGKVDCLTMLAAKTTCKDRWRQVLAEANKINNKHLFTLQPSITENQTDEMRQNGLQLVVPKDLKKTYKATQQSRLMTLWEFISLVKEREKSTILI